MFSTADTIVAIATPPGHGGIGVVRVTGDRALEISGAVLALDQPLQPRNATFTRAIVNEQRDRRERTPRAIDEVVATYFPNPHSYTREDVVEIAAHGSPVVLEAILQALIVNGARLAEPGEFTLRAFLNGRIDLVQAEAVADLVDAVTPAQARAAFDQLEGTLTASIGEIERTLFDLSARLEASVDFPDEGYHFVLPAEIAQELADVHARIDALVKDGERGRILREGRQVAIAGRPNVGKSTLFNALLGTARAIVTPIAGTTRDLVTETADIAGVRVCLVDTAGVRATSDGVEREGVERARRATAVADLVVVVLDRSRPLGAEDEELLQATRAVPRVVVINKCDLPPAWTAESVDQPGAVSVSLATDAGARQVRKAIGERLAAAESNRDVPAVTNVRHLNLLQQASEAIGRARVGIELGQIPEEILLSDLQHARTALEEVTGRRTSEDLLRHIFERFCIGK